MTKLPCTVDDCDTTAYTRGWCRLHYARAIANGTPYCTQCGYDYPSRTGYHGVCGDCRTAAEIVDQTCPRGCGRPHHSLPAIAARVIGLDACPGDKERTSA